MLLRDLSKVYISEYKEIDDHGEVDRIWKYKGIAWLNLQQDVNELDRKSTGEVDYTIYKGRTGREYAIEKGNGMSFTDISKLTEFSPEYRILDKNVVGNTYVYRLEQIQ